MSGDVVTSVKLNKIEDAVEELSNNIATASVTGTGFVIGVVQGEETEESEEGREVYEATCDKTVQEIITASDNGRPIIIALTLDGAPGPLQLTPTAVEVYKPTQSVIIGFGERTDEYGIHTSWTLDISANDATLTLVTVEPASGGVTSVNGQTGDVTITASDVGALSSSTTYVSSVNGNSGAVTIANATTSTAGLMSATDKANLDAVVADYSSALIALNGGGN